ncbi:hypothetical protein OpiT1DRAFT_02895 [Opitutaceae bacterium TAV1]|nr:hypothetical protein OpiT1DRAFT_02895 [Opitutaceae bacterium TAV1]
MILRKLPLFILAFVAGASLGAGVFAIPARAATWHTDAASGSDTHSGRTRAAAFATLQRAIDAAQPGDTVIAYPGIYYEHVVLRRGGKADAPIRIMADRVERDRVIITGAQRGIREKQVPWELVDRELGLWRIPLGYRPARVLTNRADLLAYPTLADLRAFRFLADDYPGHKHGFAWDPATRHIYVRLRADGRYGPVDPGDATMAVSPPTGAGRFGVYPNRPDNYNLVLAFSGPAHVIVDGFTFETPGIAGVRTNASDLTLRNNWFYGCRVGISAPRDDEPGARNRPRADRVLVENNYFTQFPAYADIEDFTRAELAAQRARSEWWQKIIHWQRKGTLPLPNQGPGYAYGYEVGAFHGIGDAWEIRNNHFYDMFEAINGGGSGHSTNANIHHNRFERICDNAIEAEPRARNLRIHHNLVLDTFEPFSWQPLSGADAAALPGPILIYDNIILQTPDAQASSPANTGAVFKLGISKDDRWWKAPASTSAHTDAPCLGGFWVAHNTVLTPSGRILTLLNPPDRPLRDFYFVNNILLAHTLSPRAGDSGIIFDNNLAAFKGGFPSVLAQTTVAALAATAAGPHGRGLPANAITADPDNFSRLAAAHRLGLDRPALAKLGATLPVPDEIPTRPAPGSVPLYFPVGPQPRDGHP